MPGKLGRSLQAHQLMLTPTSDAECEEGCYWRWLVHTLLEDVAALKRSFEDTEEGLKVLADKRKEIEETIGHRDRLVYELACMTESLKTLREDVPSMRENKEDLQQQSVESMQRNQALQDRQRQLSQQIKRSMHWQKENTKKVLAVEREADDGKRQEKTLKDQIEQTRENLRHEAQDQQELMMQNKELEAEVRELQEMKALKKMAKKNAKKNK